MQTYKFDAIKLFFLYAMLNTLIFFPQKYRNVAAVNSLANVRRQGGELRVINTVCNLQ